jgi:ribosome-binding protein aMBF1 (putative translation factor)
MSAYSHQDWTPVVFKKKQETNKTVQKSISQHAPQYQTKLTENTEEFAPKLFEKEYITNVINARISKKWTQKDLANATNIDVHRIQRLEQGKEVYDHQLKAKLNKVLGIKAGL